MAEQTVSVLTIEDDHLLRESISTYLTDSGFRVHEAENAHDGLNLFRESRPDLVFTDLSMPNGSGLDLIPLLKEESPSTPIVVISGTGRIEDAVEAMKRGAWEFIVKPIRDLSTLEDLSRRLMVRSGEMVRQQQESTRADHSPEPGNGYNPLTGLPNRTLLEERFQERIAAKQHICLVLLDLDNFKMVNATFGNQTGDDLLRQVSRRLEAARTESMTLFYLGGDEFAILADCCDMKAECSAVSLSSVFQEAFTVGTQEIYISASMGIVSLTDNVGTLDDLLRYASISARQAKVRGRNNLQHYDPDFCVQARSRVEMETHLRRALEREEFLLQYQPQIDVASGAMCGVEALVRWRRADGSMVSPVDFIPILEESGLIIPVGEWILKSACSQYSEWMRQGMTPFTLSVNISAAQFKSGNLPGTVVRVLAETGMDPACLCLELTESIVMGDIEGTLTTMKALRGLGVSLSIDDFGTGYSSLSYLCKMPICELKIDRSFIATIPDDRNNAAIVSSIIGLAHCMSIRVVAEGVETEDQLGHLAGLRCQMVQGYLFSKPLYAADLPALQIGLYPFDT